MCNVVLIKSSLNNARIYIGVKFLNTIWLNVCMRKHIKNITTFWYPLAIQIICYKYEQEELKRINS